MSTSLAQSLIVERCNKHCTEMVHRDYLRQEVCVRLSPFSLRALPNESVCMTDNGLDSSGETPSSGMSYIDTWIKLAA